MRPAPAEIIARTPAPGCPACEAKRRHGAEEWRAFHPLAGHGFTREQGWTHAELGKDKVAEKIMRLLRS